MIEFLFAALGIIPQNRSVAAISEGISWNYTTILNSIFLALAALLVIRFLRTGSVMMLRMMNAPGEHSHDRHEQSEHNREEHAHEKHKHHM